MKRVGVMGLIVLLVLLMPGLGHAGVGKLDLSWNDNATNEDGFAIESHVGPCSPGTAFTELARVGVNVKAFTHAPLGPGETVCYRVRAFNAAGMSAPSNEAAGTTLPTPGGPTNLLIAFLRALGLTAVEDWLFPTPRVTTG
jgi:hypothetical protein